MKNCNNCFRTHKTSTKNRGHYIYYLEGNKRIILEPGKDGVTEDLIKKLHAIDDAEVRNNLASIRVEIKDKSGKVIDRIYHASLDIFYENDDNSLNDKSKVMSEASASNPVDNIDIAVMRSRIAEIAKKYLTPKQQDIISLLYVGYKATEIAKMQKVSDAAISKQMAKIKAIFTEHYLNK